MGYPAWGQERKKDGKNPISNTMIFVLHSPFSVHNAQATPPGFCNMVDWRALVKSRIPNIEKLRGYFSKILGCF